MRIAEQPYSEADEREQIELERWYEALMAPPSQDRHAQALAYLQAYTVGLSEDTFVELWADGVSRYFGVGGLDKAAELVASCATDIYLNVSGSYAQTTRPRTRRIMATDADYAIAVAIDGDVKPGAFASKDAARDFFASLDVPPSWVIDSGGGLQAFWRFSRVQRLTAQTRAEAIELAADWGAHVRGQAQAQGVKLDSTHDLARLMRVPGGLNVKSEYGEPRAVLVVDMPAQPCQYDPDVLRGFLPEHVEPAREDAERLTAGTASASRHSDATVNIEDDDLLARMRAWANGSTFAALFDQGDTSANGDDDSSADLALCNLLAMACGPGGHAQVDRLFRRSALMRDKWDSRRGGSTYGAGTIDKAYAGRSDFYTPSGEIRDAAWRLANGVPTTAQTAETEPAADALPEFPTHLLPPAMQAWVTAESTRQQTPDGLLATACLGAAAGAIGKSMTYRTHDREHPAGLFVVLVAPSGRDKSPIITAAMQPIRTANRARLKERTTTALAQKEWDKAHKNDADADRMSRPLVPQRLLIDDVTSEYVADKLQYAPHGLILDPDEGGGWIDSFDLYHGKKGVDVTRWIKFFNGVDVTVGRKLEEIDAQDPRMTVVCGIQPAKLDDISGDAVGLVQRILYAVAERPPVGRKRSRATPDEAARGGWERTLTELLRLRGYAPMLMSLTPDAITTWQDGSDRCDAEADANGHDDLYAKAHTLAVRIAGALQLIDDPKAQTIDAHWCEVAWDILLGYSLPCGIVALRRVQVAPRFRAKLGEFYRWLGKREGGEATYRDIYTYAKHLARDRGEAEALAKQLEAAGGCYIERRAPEGGGTPSWWVVRR